MSSSTVVEFVGGPWNGEKRVVEDDREFVICEMSPALPLYFNKMSLAQIAERCRYWRHPTVFSRFVLERK